MQSQNTEALRSGPIGRTIFSLAAPAIAAQLINMLYNLVDRMYIGHIEGTGALALTGVGVCLPLIMIISAFAALAGMGGAPRASIYMGQGDFDRAERTLGNCTMLLLIVSVVLTIVFQVFGDALLSAFGASENTLGYASGYLRIYTLGTVFVQLTLGLNAFITAQGFSKISMLTVLIGAIANIILDPIFIFTLHMGVEGAALATILSQMLSMIWILRFLTGKKTTLRIRRENLRLQKEIIWPALALGLSPFIMNATESLIAVCFNSSLLKYGGDVAVGAMTILTSVMQFAMLPLMGMTQGAQPIVSYNYGARNAERVKQAFKVLLISSVVYATVLWAACELFPQVFARIFSNDEALIDYASRALRIYMAVSCLFSVQVACQQTFIALGNAKHSLFLACLRKIFLLVPLIYLMPAIFTDNQAMAVFMAEPVADLLAVLTTSILFGTVFGRMLREMREEAQTSDKAGD